MRLDMWLNFPKFKNSTKQPTSNPDYTLNIDLKGDDSILSPLLKLQGVPSTCVYARIHELGRYYFVKDARWLTNDIVEYSLEVDPLASYKDVIGASTHYIERCSNGYDNDVDDPLISQKQGFFTELTSTTFLPWYDNADGVYLVTLANRSSGNGIGIYAMTKNQVESLLINIFHTDMISQSVDNLITALFDPMKYIISIKWMPLYYNAMTGTDTDVQLGQWDKLVSHGILLTSSIGHVYGNAITLPDRSYNDFRDYSAKYTKVKMNLPGLGMVDLDPIDMRNGLTSEYVIDYMTGECRIRLKTNSVNSVYIASYDTKLASEIPLSQIRDDVNGVLSSAMATVGSLMSGNVIGTATSLISGFVSSLNPTPSLIGKADNKALLKNENMIGVFARRLSCTPLPTSTHGRPLADFRQISSIPGYIKCSNASLSISCTDTERDAINNYLNGGFYYE